MNLAEALAPLHLTIVSRHVPAVGPACDYRREHWLEICREVEVFLFPKRKRTEPS